MKAETGYQEGTLETAQACEGGISKDKVCLKLPFARAVRAIGATGRKRKMQAYCSVGKGI